MSETKQLALNLSGYRQLPLLTEDQARDEFRRLADLNAVPPKTNPVRDVVLAATRSDPYTPFVRSSPTSKAAADGMKPAAPSLERRVLAWLEARGAQGAADHELLAAFRATDPQTEGSTVRARRVGLVKRGLVVDSGRTRLTAKRREAAVWISVAYLGQAPEAVA